MQRRWSGIAGARLGARFVLVLAASATALVAAEGLVRIGGEAPRFKSLGLDDPATAFRRSDNPVLGYELTPGYRSDHPDASRSYDHVNLWGQRDVERVQAKPEGVRRILLLGDSVVEGHGVVDLDDTMSRQLERLYAGQKVEVLNFGVSGYCTLAEVELLATKGLAFDPDVVVLVFVANDFDNFNREVFRLTARPRAAPVEWLFAASHLFRLTAVRFDLFGYGLDVDPVKVNAAAIGDNNVVAGLARLRELADRHGFAPLVAAWPLFDDRRVLEAHPMPDAPGELVVERLAAAAGVPVVRLGGVFAAQGRLAGPDANPRLLFTTGDGIHPSPLGHRIAALALKEALDRLPPNPLARPGPLPEEAVAVARALGHEVPGYAHVHNNAGVSAQEAGDLEEAIAEFRRALAIDPLFAEARNNLGSALLRAGHPAEAIEEYRRAIAARPDLPDPHFNLGLVLEALGRRDEAAACYGRALSRKPDHARAIEALARVRAGTETGQIQPSAR